MADRDQAGDEEPRFDEVLVRLSRDLGLGADRFEHALARITEVAAEILMVDRSSVWKVDEELGELRAEEPVFVGGASAMASAFDAVDTVRTVLHTLEQQYVIVSLVRDILDRGLSVAIGAEHGIQPLAACSVIVKPVVVDGEQLGTVGVLGPTRMDYPQALATVEVVSDRLGRHLGDGSANG